MIHCRLYSFLTRYNILYDSQYDFRNKHSTINAITEFTSDIMSSFDMKHTSLAVYLDLSKAFDTIDHSIMLKKMEHYGIRGITLEWFKSYLNQRVQYVIYKTTNFKSLNIPCGVPQGSVLGPLLLILYSNDIPNSLKYFKLILFADDTTVYISGEDVTDLFRCLNHDLSKLNDWFKANKLSLNVNKTNYILFNKNTAVLPPEVCLYIGTDKLEQVRCTKLLGLHIEAQIVHRDWPNVGPTAASPLGPRWQTQLAQRWAVRWANGVPTSLDCASGPPLGKPLRQRQLTTAGPPLAQRWANGRSSLGQRQVSVGPTLALRLGKRWHPSLAQCWAVHRTNVSWPHRWATIGPTLGQRQLTAAGPPLAQCWANSRSPLGQRKVHVGPTCPRWPNVGLSSGPMSVDCQWATVGPTVGQCQLTSCGLVSHSLTAK